MYQNWIKVIYQRISNPPVLLFLFLLSPIESVFTAIIFLDWLSKQEASEKPFPGLLFNLLLFLLNTQSCSLSSTLVHNMEELFSLKIKFRWFQRGRNTHRETHGQYLLVPGFWIPWRVNAMNSHLRISCTSFPFDLLMYNLFSAPVYIYWWQHNLSCIWWYKCCSAGLPCDWCFSG